MQIRPTELSTGDLQSALASSSESGDISINDFLAFRGEEITDSGFDLVDTHIDERRSGTEEHEVRATSRSDLLGEFIHIERHDIGMLGEFLLDRLHLGIIIDINERSGVSHDPTLGREELDITESLHRFEGDDQVCAAEGNKVRENGIRAKAEIRLHIAATLAHAVDFGLFEEKVVGEGSTAEDSSDREDALTSDAGKNYI